ncbi:MAG: hypothetical protein ABT20_07705 [Rubrivivax sp. SCN 70-15]|nr:MAG: hypothetical protein ABT20_07705 [Rubrivivax sp. SCN 70-15]
MMRTTPLLTLTTLFALGAGLATPAHADDADALSLQAAPAPAAAAESPLRAALELGVGRIDLRNPSDTRDAHRASLDLRYSTRLNDAWRLTLSDRLDDTHPAPAGQHATMNSLREAFVGWQADPATSLDFGRINWRQGPAYGWNPTDYFRSGGLRTITTADPVALREMRMGTVMARFGRLWDGGGVSLALAPKLADAPSTSPGSLDLGATNAQNRALLTVNSRFSDRVSAQGLLLLQHGTAPTLGASATALASDALVAYAEWSSGKTVSLIDQVSGSAPTQRRTQQASVGLTYTLPTDLALTVEAEYNGAGLDSAGWNSLFNQGPAAYQRYQVLTQPSQELGTRRAWLFYASQKGLGLKQLDLTGFVRVNAIDHSRLVWAELRYHWPRFDAALQWQRAYGDTLSEFGFMPYRQVVQLLGTFYF